MTTLSPVQALIALRQSGAIPDPDVRDRFEAWLAGVLDVNVSTGSDAVFDMWEGALATGLTGSHPMWQLASGHPCRAIADASERLLTRRPDLPPDVLRLLLATAAERLSRATLETVADAALKTVGLSAAARARWSVLLFALRGEPARGLLDGHAQEDLHSLLDDGLGGSLLDHLPVETGADRAARAAAVIRVLGPSSVPEGAKPGRDRVLRPARVSDAAHRAIRELEQIADPTAATLIEEALAEPELKAWHPQLSHARASQAKRAADTEFTPPSLGEVLALLAGGPPVSAADLRAIVADELRRLARRFREDADVPWQDYWNTNENGKVTDAKIENVARNTTLAKLKSALEPYKIAVTLPEAAQRHGTRVDIYFASAIGKVLPIEAKRHYHPDLWTAAKDQLQGYTASEGASGLGILLVFWFGSDWTASPTRPDGKKPASADELENLLVADLPSKLRKTTDVIVLDVSRPGGGESRDARIRRMKKEKEAAAAELAAAISVSPPKPASSKKKGPKGKASDGQG